MLGNVPLIISLLTAAGAIAAAIYLPMLVKQTDLKKVINLQAVEIMTGVLLAYGVIAALSFITDLLTWRSSMSFWHW
jgi:hypothetical protein